MRRDVADPETVTDLRDLRAFCLVVDHGSITAAAKRLGETKGSVSRRLSRLERQLDVVLLRRSPRLVQPTDDGVAYRARLGRALELLDDANAQLLDAHATPHGQLRVTAPTDIAVSVLAPAVASFSERYPDVTVEMVLTEQRLDFDADQIDVAIRATSTTLEDSALVGHRLTAVEGKFFAARAYLKKFGTPTTPDELAQHRVMIPQVVRGRPLILHKGSEKKPCTARPKTSVVSSDFTFLRELAVRGVGIALLPSIITAADVAEKRLVPVLHEHLAFRGSLHLLHHGTRFLVPKVRAFRDHLLEHFKSV